MDSNLFSPSISPAFLRLNVLSAHLTSCPVTTIPRPPRRNEVTDSATSVKSRTHVVTTTHSQTATVIPNDSSQLLSGKVAIVTGAGEGIGAATAELLARHGAYVLVQDWDEDLAIQVAKRIWMAGGTAMAAGGDLTDEDTPKKVVESTVRAFGPCIDILINNAGYSWASLLTSMTTQQWEAMMEVHAKAPFLLMQAAAPYMGVASSLSMPLTSSSSPSPLSPAAVPVQSPRFIVNVVSMSGVHGDVGHGNDAAAKAALIGLTKTAAKEWGAYGIRCNAVAFGKVDTRLAHTIRNWIPNQMEGQDVTVKALVTESLSSNIPKSCFGSHTWAETAPLGRVASAEEAAGAILLMVLPYASYITGQVLEVNGGTHT